MFKKILKALFPAKDSSVEKAYDLWSDRYDEQPNNLMLALDEALFNQFLSEWQLEGISIVDVGCGTGRHWGKIWGKHPGRLAGYDASDGMLQQLNHKFPAAETYKITGNALSHTQTGSVDLIISTLTIAHIADMPAALSEWDRVLKPGGTVWLTDYHPRILAEGGKRTFSAHGRTVRVKNYVHPLEAIQRVAGQLNWELLRLVEKNADESNRSWYEKQNALATYEKVKGLPLIYGMLFRKK